MSSENLSFFVFSLFSWQNLKHEGPFAQHIFYLSRWLYSMYPVTNAPVIYSNDSSPEASGTLQFGKVCIKVSLPSPQSPWILFFFRREYLLEHCFQKAIEIQRYFQNLTTENLLFTVGKNNIFSSSIKHGKLRNRSVKLSALKVK